MGGSGVNASVSINETQAATLIHDGLHFAAADHITLDAGHGTHLSNSLKELSKLGVDSVSVTAGGEVSVDLGGLTEGDLSAAGGLHLPTFESTSATVHDGSDIKVTLDVANLGELTTAGHLGGMAAAGIDNVQINLDDSTHNYQADLNALLNTGLTTVDASGKVVTLLENDVNNVRAGGVHVDTIDVGGSAHIADVHINEAQAHELVQAGLHFAAQDHITMDISGVMAADGVHASGTHLSASLKDLHKLGVDIGGQSINNLGVDTLAVSGIANLQDLSVLTNTLKDAGIDHLGLHSSELVVSGKDSSLFKALENSDWIKNGVDVTLEIDDKTLPVTHAPADFSNSAALNELVHNGLDLLDKTHLAQNETWGSLIKTLHDAGLGDVNVQSGAVNVHINDDLSAALYESGMLHAVPDAKIEIDAVGNSKLLETSLKAMADLGVDKVHASDKVFVKLGVSETELSSIHDLFSAFGLDSTANADHSLFDNNGKGAGLVLDQKTAQTFGITGDQVDEAKVTDLVHQLSKLGITELDVVHVSADGATNSTDVFHIDQAAVAAPVAQTPIITKVEVLGASDDVSHAFDLDILHKNIKH